MSKFNTIYFIFRFYFWFSIVKLLTIYFKLIRLPKPKKDVLFLESLTFDGAGYTYRVKYWQEMLSEKGMIVESLCVVPDAQTFFKESTAQNLPDFILKNIRVRIKQIIYSRQFKIVIVRRNLVIYNQYGNHFMEKLLQAAQPNCLLDFDDDLGAQEPMRSNSAFHKIMQMTNEQFYGSFKYYNGFICGSLYLKMLLQSKVDCENISVIPTCVNYTDDLPKVYSPSIPKTITFGWIGGNHNLFLIESIIPALNKLHEEYPIQLLIIAGVENYPFHANFDIRFEQYSLETERKFLLKTDIGLMPLLDDDVSRGKCGFKLLQYMGLGIPGVASAITVNTEIIEHEKNGWLVYDKDNWLLQLRKAVSSYSQLQEIGKNAYVTVDSRYSFKANSDKYYNFILKNLA